MHAPQLATADPESRSMGRIKALLSATALLTVMTVIVTWPQARYMSTRVAAHGDVFLSMWRLQWITHALSTDVRHLFDGNIFFPHTRTLAYTDATLLEGLSFNQKEVRKRKN